MRSKVGMESLDEKPRGRGKEAVKTPRRGGRGPASYLHYDIQIGFLEIKYLILKDKWG